MCVYDFGRGEHLFDALRHNYLYDFVDARICCPLASEDRVSTSGILKRIGKFLYTSQLISCTEDLRILREYITLGVTRLFASLTKTRWMENFSVLRLRYVLIRIYEFVFLDFSAGSLGVFLLSLNYE